MSPLSKAFTRKNERNMYESFDEYIKSLEKEKENIPVHVYEFATDSSRYDLQSPHSLHDAWLTSLTIRENRHAVRPFEPEPTIEIVLLGQMHDRDIVLKYRQIEWYKMAGFKNQYNWGDTFQGDVGAHEVRLEGHFIIHEIEFVSRSSIVVACRDFTCSERMHAK